MTIAGIFLQKFEPFNDQLVDLKSRSSSGLADVHFFVGQNGTSKTRLLSLLASQLGNSTELEFRGGFSPSRAILRAKKGDQERYGAFMARSGGVSFMNGPLANVAAELAKDINSVQGSGFAVSDAIAMAFRSVPALEDQKVSPMGEVKWDDRKRFLTFGHHTKENTALCQSLANLKVRMGIVSSDPGDRTVKMVNAFDKAVESITSSRLTITVGYVDKEFRLKVSWLGKEMQLRQLPDGLRSIIGWLASVMVKLDMLLPDAETPLDAPIVLLLDEPDAHLHPAWQRKLIPAVQRMLPNAQIFVATHSPFVISSVNSGWIHVFEADSRGNVNIKPAIACSSGDSYIDVVEDVLGIKERFDPETEEMLAGFRRMREDLKQKPSQTAFSDLQEFAARISSRGPSLEFMMGRELAQLRSQLNMTAG